tara:strand:+ start:50211 stop:50636 length:426 start_codon:yes stop_codon:yes gene_type:complete
MKALLQNMADNIKAAYQSFKGTDRSVVLESDSPNVQNEEMDVIFAGFSDGYSTDVSKAFSFYTQGVGADKDAVWSIGIATDEKVIAQLNALNFGEVFNIVSEKTAGALATEVVAMETKENPVIYSIPKDTPLIIPASALNP